MTRNPAVSARAVSKYFDEVVALDEVDLVIPSGTIHGLVGPNGAGKSTLLGLLLGVAVPDAGELDVLGARVDRALGVPEGVAGFVDAPGLYPSLTARQNLVEFARLRGAGRLDVDDALADVGLTDVADDRVRGFSLGMRQRLGLAAACLARPRLLVLDEPANGLDPAGKHHVHGVLTRLAAEGTAVVLSSHRMDDLTALCAGVTILDAGRVVYSGPLDQLERIHADVLDYRVVTPDPDATARIARQVPDLVLRERGAGGTALVLSGPVSALDDLVVRLVRAEIPVRELGPLVPPLEAAFLALTGEAGAARERLARAGGAAPTPAVHPVGHAGHADHAGVAGHTDLRHAEPQETTR